MANRLLPGLLLSLLLSACVSRAPQDPADRSAPVEDRIIIDGQVMPLPEAPTIRPESLPQTQTQSTVVQTLITSARQQRKDGQLDGAAAALERALRIEPTNATLWSQLADVRFAQLDYHQAVQLAAKSNTLAADDPTLQRRNWYLIVNAYEALGNLSAADKYREKLRESG